MTSLLLNPPYAANQGGLTKTYQYLIKIPGNGVSNLFPGIFSCYYLLKISRLYFSFYQAAAFLVGEPSSAQIFLMTIGHMVRANITIMNLAAKLPQ